MIFSHRRRRRDGRGSGRAAACDGRGVDHARDLRLGSGRQEGAGRLALVALLGLAMGVHNATARALAVPDLTATVLTLTITGMASDSRAAGGRGGKTGRRALSALAMFAGALVGAFAVRRVVSDARWTDPL
jgi:hypothetical protein